MKEAKRTAKQKGNEGYSRHKDSLFRLIFKNRKDLLELYNAIRGTSYEDPDDLEITTIRDVFYMKMKNDLSFLVDSVMNLYEHQSTVNPNMPLRGMEYFAKLYRKYVKDIEADLYGKKQIRLPYPQFIVFYNGTKELPERQVLRLSDAYILPENGKIDEEPGLECCAVILNINLGKNKELMEKCGKLLEYALFVARVREKAGGDTVTEEVMDDVIEECIEENILKEILEEHWEEVNDMFSDKAWDRHVKLVEQEAEEAKADLEKIKSNLEEAKNDLEETKSSLEEANRMRSAETARADAAEEELRRLREKMKQEVSRS